jgi:hypothetical protein
VDNISHNHWLSAGDEEKKFPEVPILKAPAGFSYTVEAFLSLSSAIFLIICLIEDGGRFFLRRAADG